MAKLISLLASLVVVFSAVYVQCDLTIEPGYGTLYVVAQNGFNLTCTGEDTTEDEIDVIWYKGTQRVSYAGFKVVTKISYEPGDSSHQTELVSIYKTSTTPEDSAEYRCTLAGTPERTITVTVFNVLTQNSNVTVGEDVTIKCEAETTFEQLSLVWYKGGKMLDEIPGLNDRVTYGERNFTLTVAKTVEDDAGEYTARITFFPKSYQTQVFNVVVKMSGKPYFKNGDGNKEITISGNNSIDLSCDALGYPKPDVTWLKDDEVIQPDSNRAKIEDTARGSRLLISKVTKDDTGAYVCNVENPLGRKQRSFKVTVDAYGITTNCAMYLCYGLSQVLLLASVLSLTL